ncbi:ABC transporter ATP-binding protein [Aeromicrobium sp. YIM 150415]|uniref:ABC transporter ATP-binding protein n=1 Tax=Aeromicrobium sp. YIM 150415 TaxID=2803912 RepID=UPI001964B479|nr:ABC transporter ATP-binding protein [Aeromicrobium sp. YIM 150415]MBM9464679.1 ABC transporter ATP-binding protein [Aeromicrobium sp. YIM 150415]
MTTTPPLLEVENLRVVFDGALGSVTAVNDVSLSVDRGQTIAVVGESGSGKSVTARTIMGLSTPPGRIAEGSIRLAGRELVGLTDRQWRGVRGSQIAMVFQDPMRSLNPTMKVGTQIEEAIRLHTDLSKKQARARAIELLDAVRIAAPRRRVDEYPHQLSGGMRQRVMIALALSCGPELLIADEPTTALDVTTQQQILDLMGELQADMGMAVMLITHDIGIAASYTDTVFVMYAGQVVESAPTGRLFTDPRMPYTRALLDSIPSLDSPAHEPLPAIEGSPPDLAELSAGCSFSARCPRATQTCLTQRPALIEHEAGRAWACWHPVESKEAS